MLNKTALFLITEESAAHENDVMTFQFSDSVIRIRVVDSELNKLQPTGYFFYELDELAKAQGELMSHGVLIRGGITYGDIHFDKKNLFGPALVTAYGLESNHSVYPRIVIDPMAINEFKKNRLLQSEQNGPEGEKEYVSKCLKLSDDGLYFIDYLKYYTFELNNEDPALSEEFVKKHKEIIMKKIEEVGDNFGNVSSKYLWLVNYHNSFIEKLFKKEINKIKEYSIETDKPLFQRL